MTERRRTKADPEPVVEITDGLHTKYRPKDLNAVHGQDDVVKSLRASIKARARQQVFLFVGPPGTGKTTLARILAAEFDVPAQGITEHDAARNSGIDDMRALTEGLRYAGFGDKPNKAIILNECQGLSKQAWDALLDETEQPPPHVFFFFTSTDATKIPKAMVTRAVTHYLRPVRRDDILDVLDYVCKEEGLDTPSDILDLVADAAEGSVRHALTMLAKVQDVTDLDEAADMLRTPLEDSEVVELCRLLIRRELTWSRLRDVVKNLEDKPAETCRIIITAYLTSCLMGAKSDRDAGQLLAFMREFSQTYNASDKMAPLLLSFDRILFD